MKIEEIKEINEFEKIQKEWDSLLEKSKNRSIFLSWDWIYFWWKYFKSDKELFILLIKDETTSQIMGIAPFCIQKNKLFSLFPFKKIKFLGTEKVASDFLDFIIYPGLENEVVKSVFEYLNFSMHDWDMIEIAEMDGESESIKLLRMNFNGKYKFIEYVSQLCPFIKLTNNYELLLQSLSSKMRGNLKWQTKQLENKYKITLSINCKSENLQENMGRLFKLHNERFISKDNNSDKSSSFSGAQIESFHYDIAYNFLFKNLLKLYFLNKENEKIACLYAFKYKDRLFYYQIGFDPKLKRLSLGNVLLGYSIRDSIKEGLNEFHFLRGNEEYKNNWTKEFRTTKNIIIFDPSFQGTIFYFIIKTKVFLKNILKKK